MLQSETGELIPSLTSRILHLAMILCLLACSSGSILCADPLEPLRNQCTRIELDPTQTPVWVASGAWNDDTMYWVDAWRSEVVEVDPFSGRIEVRELPWKNTLEADWASLLEAKTKADSALHMPPVQGPATIWPEEGGFSLEYKVPLGFVAVGPDLELRPEKAGSEPLLFDNPESPRSTKTAGTAAESWLHGSHYTAPLGSGFWGFGSIRTTIKGKSDYSWSESFFYVENSQFMRLGQNIDALAKLSPNLQQQYHRFYLPAMTSVAGTGFALLLDETPVLLRYNPRTDGTALERLPDFPEDFRTRPKLQADPKLRWHQNELRWYYTLQESDLAAALYSIENRLFLLGKKMQTPSQASWWLVELNPATGAERHRYRLPVRPDALHLTVVPGPDLTTLIEKQAVQATRNGLPYFQVLSMTHIPTDWLMDPMSSALDPESSIPCR